MSNARVQPLDPTRERILDATSLAIAQYGVRKVNLSEIATLAGVSRPTLYKHFASKEELLLAVADHEKDRFASDIAAALRGVHGIDRLERALRFMVDFQQVSTMRGLVVLEPGFMLDQLRRSFRTMRAGLIPIFKEVADELDIDPKRAKDLADLATRAAWSHFMIEGDNKGQLLWELRHIAGLDQLEPARKPPKKASRPPPARRSD
jgi:AcrR family transcriptional regulator